MNFYSNIPLSIKLSPVISLQVFYPSQDGWAHGAAKRDFLNANQGNYPRGQRGWIWMWSCPDLLPADPFSPFFAKASAFAEATVDKTDGMPKTSLNTEGTKNTASSKLSASISVPSHRRHQAIRDKKFQVPGFIFLESSR
ncbi:MAG TPA: hypothetical protein VK785_06250 [Opitutaceae bacterium]|jgi:hypothetical protein|nr:hypothetical protein [Opitutaceae bacterium]